MVFIFTIASLWSIVFLYLIPQNRFEHSSWFYSSFRYPLIDVHTYIYVCTIQECLPKLSSYSQPPLLLFSDDCFLSIPMQNSKIKINSIGLPIDSENVQYSSFLKYIYCIDRIIMYFQWIEKRQNIVDYNNIKNLNQIIQIYYSKLLFYRSNWLYSNFCGGTTIIAIKINELYQNEKNRFYLLCNHNSVNWKTFNSGRALCSSSANSMHLSRKAFGIKKPFKN